VKGKIKEFVLSLGIDDVGIASVKDYKSPRTPDLQSIFPGAKSLVVLAYKTLSNCESENMQIAMGGRLDEMEFKRSSNYRVARFLENELKAKAMTVCSIKAAIEVPSIYHETLMRKKTSRNSFY